MFDADDSFYDDASTRSRPNAERSRPPRAYSPRYDKTRKRNNIGPPRRRQKPLAV